MSEPQFQIHNTSKSVLTRTVRSSAPGNPKTTLLLAGGSVRVLRGRPVLVTFARLQMLLAELIKHEERGFAKVTDSEGRKVDLKNLRLAPPAPVKKAKAPLVYVEGVLVAPVVEPVEEEEPSEEEESSDPSEEETVTDVSVVDALKGEGDPDGDVPPTEPSEPVVEEAAPVVEPSEESAPVEGVVEEEPALEEAAPEEAPAVVEDEPAASSSTSSKNKKKRGRN